MPDKPYHGIDAERYSRILAMRNEGLKMREIAEKEGVTASRAQQLVNKAKRLREKGQI